MGRRRIKGFTLIEMLIAMTLLGILVVLLFSVLRIAAESWNAGESRTVEVNRKAVVYQFFKRHLATIRPVTLAKSDPNNGEEPQQAFQGYPQRMAFVASLPASSARKGWQIFEIGPDPNLPSRIMVGLSPYQPTANYQADKVVLLDHVKTFSFAYFGSADNATAGDSLWQEQWTGMTQLPQLIKVSIQLEDGGFWPDMLFPVRINGKTPGGGSPPQ
ncbi:MAG: prepilin-type N-terminal cleavage/methylation domain-containing protein [Methylococcales bacterium]|nr:prepilin-type N-terminal cleavage/methylation domain-containing protein [Methylococcales bacterium]